MKIKIGDLLQDQTDGDIGLVVEIPRDREKPRPVALVQWGSLRSLVEMDYWAIEKGWVKVVSEA